MNFNGHYMVRFLFHYFFFVSVYLFIFIISSIYSFKFLFYFLIAWCFCQVIPDIVVRSLKEFVTFPRTGVLTLEVTLESGDDIYVSTPCSYFIGLGNRMVFKQEGFSDFLQASSIEVNNLVLITFKERDRRLVVIFNLLP